MLQLYQAHIGLTTRCNLRCPHCYSIAERLRTGESDMPLERLDLILTKLKKYGVFKIIFAYAESLLFNNFFEALKLTKSKGFDIELTTNAIELTPDVIKKLEDIGVDKIQISLDFPDERHDKFRNYPHLFQKVINALEELQKNKSFRTRILCTQWSDNIDFYKKFQKLADIYHIDVVAFLSAEIFSKEKLNSIREIINIMRTDKRFVFHSPLLAPKDCFVGKILHINPWGNFTLCPLSNEIIGNFLTMSDDEIVASLSKSSKLICLKGIKHAE